MWFQGYPQRNEMFGCLQKDVLAADRFWHVICQLKKRNFKETGRIQQLSPGIKQKKNENNEIFQSCHDRQDL